MSRVEAATRVPLGSVSATRTAVQRRERDVWDITLTRGTDTSNRSVTVHELREDIKKQGLQRAIHLAELELAEFNRVPPPDPPDPLWVDEVAVAQGKIDDVDALVMDLNYLLDVLVNGGE